MSYGAHMKTKLLYPNNPVFTSMANQLLNISHHIYELERTQLLTILAISPQIFQLAGCHSTGNHSNFLFEEDSTAWLYDFLQFPSLLFETEKSFDRKPKNYQDTVMYSVPLTRQTLDYANSKTCEGNP